MAAFTVTTAADVVNAGDGVLSLREAVARANATGEQDTISFANALEGRTLALAQGELVVTSDVAMQGDRNNDGAAVTLDGGGLTNILRVGGAGGVYAQLAGMRLVNGGYTDQLTAPNGSGITVDASNSLRLNGCEISGCESYSSGAGLALGLNTYAILQDTLVARNRSTAYGENSPSSGGGIYQASGSLRIIESTIAGNLSEGFGRGGGIASNGEVTIEGSTIAGNSAAIGGGILAQDGLRLTGSTITANRSYDRYVHYSPGGEGAGILAQGSFTIANTIVAGNISGNLFDRNVQDDVVGTITLSNGHNLFGSAVVGNVAGDREGVDPVLVFAATDPLSAGGVLALNGGPTPTAALRDELDNPALSGAEPVAAGSADQRGAFRPLPVGTNPDVGAFELDHDAISRSPTAGNDALVGTTLADVLTGRAGADRLTGRGGDDRLIGNDGGDTILGGLGNDVLDGGPGLDTASYRDVGVGVTASLARLTSSGAGGADRLFRLENLQGGSFDDRLEGNALANALGGGGGGDRLLGLKGEDLLRGGDGADLLRGGPGADRPAGGPGRDLFDYDRLADSTVGANRDVIADFAHLTDRVDLSTLDARSATAANDAFVFRGPEGTTFTGAGQVRWFQEGGATFVEANVDADRTAELQIELVGLKTLTGGDFVL